MHHCNHIGYIEDTVCFIQCRTDVDLPRCEGVAVLTAIFVYSILYFLRLWLCSSASAAAVAAGLTKASDSSAISGENVVN